MSAILHPVQNQSWWYATAAAALAVGLLIVLMNTVFSGSGTDVVTPAPLGGHAHVYAPPCHMGRPGGSIEMTRPGCPA